MVGSERSLQIDCYRKELLVDVLKNTLDERSFDASLNERLKGVVTRWEFDKYKRSRFDDSTTTQLDALDLERPAIVFTTGDKRNIQTALERSIIEKYPALLQHLDEITEGEIMKDLEHQSSRRSRLSREQQETVVLCERYYDRLRRLRELNVEMCGALKRWVDLRLGPAAKNAARNAELCNLRSKVVELEIKIINVQLKRFVYGGTASNVKDYTDYYKNLRNNLDLYRSQIYEYKKYLGGDGDAD